MKSEIHIPVLVKEVLFYLEPSDGKVYVDCTLGTGGHTKKILQDAECKMQNIKIYGIDRDKESMEIARRNLSEFKDSVEFIHGNFKDLKEIIKERVDGVLFDLGLSSFQLGDEKRGFSYKLNGLLDMRMDREEGKPCYEFLNKLDKEELEEIIRNFGEERYSERIANSIYDALPIETTFELRNAILKVIPNRYKEKTLSRVFQALRIKINDELTNLKIGLESAMDILKEGGKILCISYHSLEDRIVKHFFKEKEGLTVLTKKPVRPTFEEKKINKRARSAKMRVGIKIKNL